MSLNMKHYLIHFHQNRVRSCDSKFWFNGIKRLFLEQLQLILPIEDHCLITIELTRGEDLNKKTNNSTYPVWRWRSSLVSHTAWRIGNYGKRKRKKTLKKYYLKKKEKRKLKNQLISIDINAKYCIKNITCLIYTINTPC